MFCYRQQIFVHKSSVISLFWEVQHSVTTNETFLQFIEVKMSKKDRSGNCHIVWTITLNFCSLDAYQSLIIEEYRSRECDMSRNESSHGHINAHSTGFNNKLR